MESENFTQPTLEIGEAAVHSKPQIKSNNKSAEKVIVFQKTITSTVTVSSPSKQNHKTRNSTQQQQQQIFNSSISANPNISAVAQATECPMWVSEPNPTRHDQLVFYHNSEKTEFMINLDDLKFIILGRSTSSCHYILSHPTVSRKHALIAHDVEGRLQIMDLGSLHGTFINSKKLIPSSPHTLNGGEQITLGEDSSYLLVVKNSINQRKAMSLLERKKSLDEYQFVNNNNSNKNNATDCDLYEKELKDYKEEVLVFFSHLNKTNALDNDPSIKSAIDQLTPTASPIKMRKPKEENKSRKRKSINDDFSRHVHFRESAERFKFDYNNELINFQTDQMPLNSPQQENPVYSLQQILRSTNFTKFQEKQNLPVIKTSPTLNFDIEMEIDDESTQDDDSSEEEEDLLRAKRLKISGPDSSNGGNNSNNSTVILLNSLPFVDISNSIPKSTEIH